MSSFSASAVIFNVGKGDEGVVQNGTRHVRVDERGWLWLTCRGVMHSSSASLLDKV